MTVWNKCPGCGFTTSGDSNYCPNCGEPWNIQCLSCGTVRRFWEFHKFCPRCGTRIEWRGITKGKPE